MSVNNKLITQTMQTKFFLVAVLLATTVAFAVADDAEEPVTDEQADCISQVLRQLEVDGEQIGDMGEDIVETARRLQAQRERCEAMRVDEPTAIQERMYEACRLAWSASVAYELGRLRGNSNSRDFLETAVSDVQECRAAQ